LRVAIWNACRAQKDVLETVAGSFRVTRFKVSPRLETL